MSFLKRILSALILGPIVIYILYYGGVPFTMFTATIFGIAMYEFWNISRIEVAQKWRLGVFVFGVIYCILAFCATTDLREEHGFFYTGLLIIGVWASDIGGYIFGRLIKGPKLAPRISPNKTIAGLAGACLFPALILDSYMLFFMEDSDPAAVFVWSIIASIVIGVVGQLGDLFISSLKRRVGIKDTGNLIPGHGGVLDRIDAMMLVIIVFWLLLELKLFIWP